MKSFFALAVVALLLPGVANAQHAVPKPGEPGELELSGPTPIRAFAPGRQSSGVYLQDGKGRWFYASFISPCHDIDFALDIGLKPFAGGTRLISGDTVLAGHSACEVASLVHSDPPPTRPRRVFRPHRILPSNGWRGAGQD
jgi:hypothetical protein